MSFTDETSENIIYAKDDDSPSEKNVATLINLKFAIERQISTLHETFKESKQIKLVNTHGDLDIYGLVALYDSNIEIYGNIFLEKQIELLKSVDEHLLRKCQHNWINDVVDTTFSSRNICYCAKCYIYK
jgi:hypothetical protein